MVRDLVYILKENYKGLGTAFANFMSGEIGQLIFRRAYLIPGPKKFRDQAGKAEGVNKGIYIYNSKRRSKMKKTTITFLTIGLLLISGVKAQTIQEGMNHLYADRYKSATGVFEKLLAANPNNIDAIYWLGQTYLETDEMMMPGLQVPVHI